MSRVSEPGQLPMIYIPSQLVADKQSGFSQMLTTAELRNSRSIKSLLLQILPFSFSTSLAEGTG